MTGPAAALFLLGAFSLRAQTPFQIETRVVQVPVSVTTADGKNVDGLRAADFTVLDDGARTEITLDTFGSGFAPISLVLAIQTSGLSTPALAKIRRIGSMIQPLVIGAHGEAAVLVFDSDIDWIRPFTADGTAIQSTMKKLRAAGSNQARLLDAVVEAAKVLRDRKRRKVLLVISESKDRGSRAQLPDALEAVEREGVEVFAAPYSASAAAWISKPEDLPPPSAANFLTAFNELFRLGKTNHVQALAQSTGGAEYPFLRERSLEKAIENFGAEIHSQYILAFRHPTGVPAGMHHIKATLPGRTGLTIRARRAYWSD
jgi:VWFA-related protein